MRKLVTELIGLHIHMDTRTDMWRRAMLTYGSRLQRLYLVIDPLLNWDSNDRTDSSDCQ